MNSPKVPPKAAGGLAAAIALILAAVAANEGGYVNNPADPGGETNHGITKRVAVANGFAAPMKTLPKETAQQIYTREYIEKPGYAAVIALDPAVGEEIVDSGVNAGTDRASRWFQESLNHFNDRGRLYADVPVDGKLGAVSLAAFDTLRARRGKADACRVMLRALDARQAAHYAQIMGRDGKLEAFGWGWFRTRIGNVDPARCGQPS